jgi:putative tryptophan/tyrosine transport system substrate-binding protein
VLGGFAASSASLAMSATVTRAQSTAGRPRIGFLGAGSQQQVMGTISKFQRGLQELGYVEGRSVEIESRFAEGHAERLPALAKELVEWRPDVILCGATVGVLAAREAAPRLPIVCTSLVDPVRLGVIASYAHPGGTVTGILLLVEGMTGKALDLARELVPGAVSIGLLVNVSNPIAPAYRREAEAADPKAGVKIVVAELRDPDGIASAFDALVGGRAEVVIVPLDFMLFNERRHIAALAAAARTPAVYGSREHVEDGGLISYGVSQAENYHRAAAFVDKILKGASPGDLPVEFSTKLELVINLKVAKTLGLTIPQSILLRADEVIE